MVDAALTLEAVIGANVPFAFRRCIRARNLHAKIGPRGGRGRLDRRSQRRAPNLSRGDACYKNKGKENFRAVQKHVTNECGRVIKTEREIPRKGPQSSNVTQLLAAMLGQCYELYVLRELERR